VSEALGILALLAVVACVLLVRFFARGHGPQMHALAFYFGMLSVLYSALFFFEVIAGWPLTVPYALWRSFIFRVGQDLALGYLLIALRPNGRPR
jgi:hypothetical protein